jgi:GH24 family phage-related lysozyme (muramidase)
MRRHINATTAQARNKGLEGAKPGTSASLIYTDHKGRKLEGRQSYPVRVYADNSYVGILNPGETIDTFAASRIDEIPAPEIMESGTEVVPNQTDPVEKETEEVVYDPSQGYRMAYSTYESIPQSFFEVPQGEFEYTARVHTGDDADGNRIYEDQINTGVHDPAWYDRNFDPYTYYKTGQYEGMEWKDTPAKSYFNNPHMTKPAESPSYMDHPLVWDDERLRDENKSRYHQGLINKVYNADGTIKPEYQQQIGSQRYLRPFGTNAEDAPNNVPDGGRWASEWTEGSSSGWGQDGIVAGNNMGYNDKTKYRTFVEDDGDGPIDWNTKGFQEFDEKGLKKLYKTYKKKPGFGKMSKKEFVERYKAGDRFHPQVLSSLQEEEFTKVFEDKVMPFKQEDFNLQKDFFNGGINSDLYRQKLVNQGYDNVDDIIKKRENHLSTSTMNYEDSADNFMDESVDMRGGPDSDLKKDKFDPAYEVHNNRMFSVNDKRFLLADLYNQDGKELDFKGSLSAWNDYTPIGDEAPPTKHGFFNKGEEDALFWARNGRNFQMGKHLGDKIIFGGTGSRAYVGHEGDNKGKLVVSPRQAQQINIDLGGDGSTQQLKSSLDEISAHELGHMSGAVLGKDFGLNKTDQNTIHRLMDESGVDRSTLDSHDNAPHERKADLDALRWKMFNTIGYDYRETPMTNEILEKYQNHIKENPSPSLINDRNFKFFNNKSLVEFNNTVADLGEQMPAGMSRYGGPAKYNHGSDVQIQEPNLDIQAPQTPPQDNQSPFSHEELDYVDFIQNRKPYRDEHTLGEDAELFFLDLYNTELTADELLDYYVWKDELSKRRSILNKTDIDQELRKLDMDKGAYDIQGFWKSGDYQNTDSDGHGSDRWKKPNHVTFSKQSKYAKNYELPEGEEDNRSEYDGGTWGDNGSYTPTIHNMHPTSRIHSEFNNEPNRIEHLYMGNDLIYNSPFYKNTVMPNDTTPAFNFQQGELPIQQYQDGTQVTIPDFIPEPNTAEMDTKFTNMYRDQDQATMDQVTFDGSTSEGMLDYLKFTENGIASGYKKNKEGEMKWYPHKDNKGIWTIGYGHNIGSSGKTKADYKDGLTQTEVDDLLKSDMKVHTDLLAKNVPEWENLSTLQQNSLLDIQYNIRGNVWTKFPSFTKAVVNKDWKNVVLEGSREEYNDKPNQRNTAFYKSMIEPMVNEWRPEIRNPEAPIVPANILGQKRHVARQDNTMVGPNSFGGFEDGGEVPTDPPEDDIYSVDIEEGLEQTNRDFQIKYPNYSDPEIYQYYLEGKNPEDGMINRMLPEVISQSNSSKISPVPFYSTTFATKMDIPNLHKETGEKCVAYGKLQTGCSGGLQLAMEFNTDLSKNGVRNINGIRGDAWEMHNNVVTSGGMSLFNYSDFMDTDFLRSNPNEATGNYLFSRYNNARSQLGNQASLDEATLQIGDFVDLYYAGSSYQNEAVRDGLGSNMNSHVGKVTEKNGKLYVTHNISGTWYSDPLDKLLADQRISNGHQVMVVGGYRPKYESALIPGFTYNDVELDIDENKAKGWNGELSSEYLNNLTLTMPDIQSDFNFSDGDSSLIANASYGTFGAESTFGEGSRYNYKDWSREFLRGYKEMNDDPSWNSSTPNLALSLLPKSFTEGTLNMDDLSEGMTQIKHQQYMRQEHTKTLFDHYGISDPNTLYTPAGASRGTAIVHALNLDLINRLFKDHDLSDQTKTNMLYNAYNKGFDNVLKSFVDLDETSEGYMTITPTSFAEGRKVYKERHLDKSSYTYVPNQLSKRITYDHSKSKQHAQSVREFGLETMTGFESGLIELQDRMTQLTDNIGSEIDNIDINKRTIQINRNLKKAEELLQRGVRTKKIKFINKANSILDNIESKSESTKEKVEEQTNKSKNSMKNAVRKIKSLF